jgi:hypothetical protein
VTVCHPQKVNLCSLLVPLALYGVVANFGLCNEAAAESVIVALEHFEDDLGAMPPANGAAKPSLKGLPSGQGNNGSSTRVLVEGTPGFIEGTECCAGQMTPGRWVTNGYDNAPPANLGPSIQPDTNPNMGTSSLPHSNSGLGPAEVLPRGDSLPGGPSGFQGFYHSRSTADTTNVQGLDGILQFTTADGAPITAQTGDRVVGEFQILWQDGGLSFALVSDIPTLQQEQLDHSWDGATPPLPRGIHDSYTGGDYFDGITGLINGNLAASGTLRATIDNGAGEVRGIDLEEHILYPSPISFGNKVFQRISFDYTVGSSTYNELKVERFLEANNPNSGILEQVIHVDDDEKSPVPTGAIANTIQGIVFSGASGSRTEYWLDNIQVEIIYPEILDLAWSNAAGGSWGVPDNWNPRGVASGNTKNVTFGDVITSNQTIISDTAITAKSVSFDNSNSYAIAGTASLTLEADTGNAALNVSAGSQGDHEVQLDLVLGSNTDVNANSESALTLNGQLNLGGNTLDVQSGRLNINNINDHGGTGILSNSGNLGGSGLINGDLINTASGTLEVAFVNFTAADALEVTGIATLGGLLDVVGDAVPAPGSFTVLTASSIVDNGLALTPAADALYDLSVSGSSVTLTRGGGTSGLVGDYDESGTVDAADYTVWRDALGTNTSLPNDEIGGMIDIGHYNQWVVNFGHTSSGSSAAVPEPASGLILLVTLALPVVNRYRTRV